MTCENHAEFLRRGAKMRCRHNVSWIRQPPPLPSQHHMNRISFANRILWSILHDPNAIICFPCVPRLSLLVAYLASCARP